MNPAATTVAAIWTKIRPLISHEAGCGVRDWPPKTACRRQATFAARADFEYDTGHSIKGVSWSYWCDEHVPYLTTTPGESHSAEPI